MRQDAESLILQKLSSIQELLQKQQSRPMTLEEAAEFLHIKQSYLYKLTSSGDIPHYKPSGKKIYFDRDELVAWALRNRVATNDEIEAEADTYTSIHSRKGR